MTQNDYPLTLIFDGQNMLHRARSGFQLGDHACTYNLFRSLKPLIEKFNPQRVVFTLEGKEEKRVEIDPEYKANRKTSDPVEIEKRKKFYSQCDEIIDLLSKYFPVSVMRHPHVEADDLIWNIINRASRSVNFIVVSTDTDFIQLLNNFPNVRLYNPVQKSFVENIDHYLLVKSLTGDGSDNVKGLDGMGPVTAKKLIDECVAISTSSKKQIPLPIVLLRKVEETYGELAKERLKKNLQLIKFYEFDESDVMKVTSSNPERNWEAVATKFEGFEFKSMLKSSYWEKFTKTFDTLWNAD